MHEFKGLPGGSIDEYTPKNGSGIGPMSRLVRAVEFKCRKCKTKQADVWWPVIDPDIPSYPYCSHCVTLIMAHLELALDEDKRNGRQESQRRNPGGRNTPIV